MNASHIDIADGSLLGAARNIVLNQEVVFDDRDLIESTLVANDHLAVHGLASSQELGLGDAMMTTSFAAPFLTALFLRFQTRRPLKGLNFIVKVLSFGCAYAATATTATCFLAAFCAFFVFRRLSIFSYRFFFRGRSFFFCFLALGTTTLRLHRFDGSFFLSYLLARTSTLLRRRFLSIFFTSRHAGARTALRFFFTFFLGHTWRCRKSRFLECRSLEKQSCCWSFRHGLFFHNVSMLTELALLGLYSHAFKRKSLRSRMRRPQACAFSQKRAL